VAIPEVGSTAVKVTVTLVRFQPLAFAAGSTEADIVGWSRSTPII
jgi:hypothetical protein